jgi:endonuclease/exonuclease/phosphatase family metal-dependent hydrolase
MRISTFLLFLSFLLATSCSYNNDRITVFSFNIRYDNPADGENSWSNRKHMVSDLINSVYPDIMGMQEVTHSQFSDLGAMLPEYARSGVGRDDGKEKGEYAAILYKKTRFNLLDESTFWLSEHPDDTGSVSWGAHLPRVVSWVKLEEKKTKKIFFLFNTHFSHVSDSARTQSAMLLTAKMKAIAGNKPVMLTGDFNFTKESAGYAILTGKSEDTPGLMDAQFVSTTPHFGGTETFNGFGDVEDGEKIDFVFVNNSFRVLQHGIYPIHDKDHYISDHYPVFVELEFVQDVPD